jgi:hypothetical protein
MFTFMTASRKAPRKRRPTFMIRGYTAPGVGFVLESRVRSFEAARHEGCPAMHAWLAGQIPNPEGRATLEIVRVTTGAREFYHYAARPLWKDIARDGFCLKTIGGTWLLERGPELPAGTCDVVKAGAQEHTPRALELMKRAGILGT